MIFHLKYYIPFLAASLVQCMPQHTHKTSCEALKSRLHLENTTIVSSTHISAPNNVTAIGTNCGLGPLTPVSSSICRVVFFVNTTSTSSIRAEAWLPDTWYGRFLAVGNSGLAGCLDYLNLDYGASLHFATVGSNNGHDGEFDDGRPFVNNPEVINDFAYRAIHVEAVIGKQIVDAYYGSRHHRSYFLGCSTGGRQGTQAALKYPEDFDGIIAGSPATDWNHFLGWAAMLARDVGAPNPTTSPSFIPPNLWNVVSAEILNQCDALDGVKDGIIAEPDSCNFRPEAILCLKHVTENCLSVPQAKALRKIYQPLYGQNGEILYPRYDPGAEADGNAQAELGGSVFTVARDWYRYPIFNNASYDFSDFSVKDIVHADRINPGGIRTFDGDLSVFKKRGGKFIAYHGRRDQLIASGNSKRVYNLISKTMHLHSLDPFYRLFLVPGMNHCISGPGAWRLGQYGLLTNAVNASSHNILLAMVDWVEQGIPPQTVIGTAEDGSERAHCRYPQRSIWNGKAFECR